MSINGRTLVEVLADLRKTKQPTKQVPGRKDAYYFSDDEYVDAFDTIVGPANYTAEYSDFQYTLTGVGEQQELYSVKCRITIIDDDGKPVLYREGYGGYLSKYEKNTHRDVNLNNAPDMACSYAFKSAAKRFGTFGGSASAIMKGNSLKGTPRSSEGGAERKAEPSRQTLIVFTKGAFFPVGEKDGKPIYKVNCHEIVGDRAKSSTSQIIFYPNNYTRCADKMNKLISECSDTNNVRLRINATRVGSNSDTEQFVFHNFAA